MTAYLCVCVIQSATTSSLPRHQYLITSNHLESLGIRQHSEMLPTIRSRLLHLARKQSYLAIFDNIITITTADHLSSAPSIGDFRASSIWMEGFRFFPLQDKNQKNNRNPQTIRGSSLIRFIRHGKLQY